MKYLSMSNLHFLEIFLWLLLFVGSVYGAVNLIGNNWQRYNQNPTVIAIEKNYKEWNITFPAATFCFIDNLDVARAKQFILDTWGIRPGPNDENDDEENGLPFDDVGSENSSPSGTKGNSDSAAEEEMDVNELNTNDTTMNVTVTVTTATPGPNKYLYYLKFLRTLVNTSYDDLHLFQQYENDETLKNLNLKETILQVIRVFRQNSTFYTKDFKDRQFFPTPTEMGMCYTHGGKLADYISLSDKPNIRHDLQLPTCTFENTLCYARTEGTPSDIRYYIHSPYDIPDTSSRWFLIKGRMGRDMSFTVLETTVSPEIYDLSPSQRKCRFMFEPTDSHMQVYSFNLCQMQCRKEIAYRLCGCAPYFYVKEARIPICGLEGLICLSRYEKILNTLRTDSGKKLPCDCLPQCIDCKYFVDKDTIQQWSFPAPYDIRFRWAVEKFSKIRLRRDVIFSFQDLVVSFGGTAALFLGCSVLSFVEIVYFFTIRLFWFIRSQKKEK